MGKSPTAVCFRPARAQLDLASVVGLLVVDLVHVLVEQQHDFRAHQLFGLVQKSRLGVLGSAE